MLTFSPCTICQHRFIFEYDGGFVCVANEVSSFSSSFLSPNTARRFPKKVFIGAPGQGPQLCGVLVLLPTRAERLLPAGPPPGANERTLDKRQQPLRRIRSRQQVRRRDPGGTAFGFRRSVRRPAHFGSSCERLCGATHALVEYQMIGGGAI